MTCNFDVGSIRIKSLLDAVVITTAQVCVNAAQLEVDGKNVIVTEASIRRDLQLAEEEGVDCLPNSTIFEQLALIGPKTTAWNEFSSTVASAIICLATNKKFNFSKWIFDSMVRNLDNVSGNILMYPRFEQVPQPSDSIKHVVDEAIHKELGDSLVRADTIASSLEAEQDSGNINKTQSKATPNESSSQKTSLGGGPSDEDRMKLNELMKLCTNLQTRVLELEKTKTSQGNEIASLKRRVKKLEKRNKSRTHKLKKLYKVGLTARVESLNEASLGKDASKHERIEVIDADEDITLVNDQDIVDWKIYKEGKKSYYQIIRADGKTKLYMVFSKMLEHFDREDFLEDLYKLVTAKFESTRPVEDMDLLLWDDLKTMFKPHVFMLVEKSYPLTPPTLTMMLEKKLQREDCWDLKLLDAVGITAAQVCINVAQLELVLLVNFNEKYTKCLLLLIEVKTAGTKVNAASGREDCWDLKLLDAVGITAAQVCINVAQLELGLPVNFNEKYTKCLLLLIEVKTAGTKVNAASGS
nr:hypothetical protein [Tanacetum cinerariifolium]